MGCFTHDTQYFDTVLRYSMGSNSILAWMNREDAIDPLRGKTFDLTGRLGHVNVNGMGLPGCVPNSVNYGCASEPFAQMFHPSYGACAEICQGFEFMGLQGADKCFCGNAYGHAGRADDDLSSCGVRGVNCASGSPSSCRSAHAVYRVPRTTGGLTSARGRLVVREGADTSVRLVQFVGSSAALGGAVYVHDSKLAMERVSFVRNAASKETHFSACASTCASMAGGTSVGNQGLVVTGAGMVDACSVACRTPLEDAEQCKRVTCNGLMMAKLAACNGGCDAAHHSSFSISSKGGGLYGVCSSKCDSSLISLSNVEFAGNFAAQGGAIYISRIPLRAEHVVFVANRATDAGGALFVGNAAYSEVTFVHIDSSSFISSESPRGAVNVGRNVALLIHEATFDSSLAVACTESDVCTPLEEQDSVPGRDIVATGSRLLKLLDVSYGARVPSVTIAPDKSIATCGENPCPAGFGCQETTFNGLVTTLSCVPCPSGQHSTDGVSCLSCIPGSGPSTNRTTCEPCAAQYYSSCDTDSECVECPSPGVVSDDHTACSSPTTSFRCSAGLFCPADVLCRRARDCVACPPGSFSTAGSQCISCSSGVGRVANANQTGCVHCVPGTAASADHSSCLPCGNEQFSNFETALRCETCQFPRVINSNRTTCTKCPRGYGPTAGEGRLCIRCTGRDFGTGDDVCKQCPDDKVTSPRNDGCVPCENRQVAVDGQCLCAPGNYNASDGILACSVGLDCDIDATRRSGCEPCPDDCIRCPVGTDGRSSVPMLKAGYGMPESLARKGHSLARIRDEMRADIMLYPCPLPSMCVGEHFVVAKPEINATNIASFLSSNAEIAGDLKSAKTAAMQLVHAAGKAGWTPDAEVLDTGPLMDARSEEEQLTVAKAALKDYYVSTPDDTVVVFDSVMEALAAARSPIALQLPAIKSTALSCRIGHDELSPLCATCAENYAGGSTSVCNDCNSADTVTRIPFFFVLLGLVYLLLIHAPAKFIEKREEQKRQAQALIHKDGYVHVAEAEDERASMIVYAKIIVSHFQIL